MNENEKKINWQEKNKYETQTALVPKTIILNSVRFKKNLPNKMKMHNV